MDRDDWLRLVQHLRTEIHRYYPDCPMSDIGVSVSPIVGRGLILTCTPDHGKTIIRLRQRNAGDSDAEFFAFTLPSGRVLTLPLPA